jgi:hypothetical protein
VLALVGEERPLAWATDAGQDWLVATDAALWVPQRSRLVRIGWEHVDTLRWDRDAETLTVVEALADRPRTWVIRLVEPGRLPHVARERVNATVVHTRRVPLDHGAVTLVARRPPGATHLTWTVSADPGVDVADERVSAQVDEALRVARADLGESG